MINSSKKVFSLAVILTAVFTLLCLGFYTFELLSAYSPSEGQFREGVFSDVFLPLLYILSLVAFAVFGFLFRGALTGHTYKNVLSVLFASGFGALVTLVWLITFLVDFFDVPPSGPALPFGIVLILLGIVAIGYFVLCATPSPSHTNAVLFGAGSALFMLVYAFYAYFDTAFALNSPIKLLDQVSAIALCLFFLVETRFRFGMISEAVFFPAGMVAFLLAASNSIAALIYFATEGYPLVTHIMHDFLFLGFALYVLSRLISFLLPPLFEEAPEGDAALAPAFETEGAVGHASTEQADLAQETFDFDKDLTEESTPVESNESNDTETAPATEAAVDFDTPTET